jgi:hypothetical protein
MLEFMKERESPERPEREERMRFAPAATQGGKYHLLHNYLKNRYADTVVLTLQQIEDLLGFALPDGARHDPDWWRADDPGGAGGLSPWTLARRTARPNLRAQTVVFDRIA